MSVAGSAHRDRAEVDALVADRYLDALLSAADRGADDAPADAAVAPEMREAARVLRRALVRLHPSFRFEDRLAARLAALAAVQAQARAAGSDGAGAVIPFPRPETPSEDRDPLLGAILAGELDPAATPAIDVETRLGAGRRPLIVGGAITSAAISLVGVAWVAWRASRPVVGLPETAIGRVARAAHVRRAARVVAIGRVSPAALTGGEIGGPA